MSLLADSLLVIARDWSGIYRILLMVLLGSAAIIFWIRAAGPEISGGSDYFVLGIAGALLPLLVTTVLASLLQVTTGTRISFSLAYTGILGIGLLILMISQLFGHPRWRPIQVERPLLIITFLVGSIFLRLAFIARLSVPQYFDGVLHYSISQELISNFRTSTLPDFAAFTGRYYHLGFHLLVASLSLVLHMEANQTILIFGQIILATIPLPMFFLIRQHTHDDAATLFGVLLAGWGWSMPAGAINWGKYPAATSILIIEFVLCTAVLLAKPAKRRWILWAILASGILAAVLIHTRSAVFLIITFGSLLAAKIWQRQSLQTRILSIGLLCAGLILITWRISSIPVLMPTFTPYRHSSMTLIVLFLIPFGLKKFPQLAFAGLLSILLLLGSLLISVTGFSPSHSTQTLLDRPFVEIILFLPLTLLGGIGLAGLPGNLKHPARIGRKELAMLAIFGMLSISLGNYNFYPTTCCKFYDQQDAVAFAWMDKNIPPDASVLIASSEAVIFETDQYSGDAGTDAGIWIAPLINRATISFPFQKDFNTTSTLFELCRLEPTYIYAGGLGQSFSRNELESRPEWYEMAVRLPKTALYRVIGCN